MNSLLAFLAVFLVDRFSKAWAFKTLADTSFAPFYGCNIVLTWNKGVSFSLFATETNMGFLLLTGFICIAIGFLLWHTIRRSLQFQTVFFESLAIAGALSNLIDRLFHGAVIDFIQLYAGPFSFPVFNVADVAIFIGACGMMFQAWQQERHGCSNQRHD